MARDTITVACGYYENTSAIFRGQLAIPGLDLRVLEMSSAPAMFAGMFKGEYDVSEMSLAELIYHRSRGKEDFIAIPVFTVRCFRHGFIICNKSIGKPRDLEGKKIGFMRWLQTAAIWIRGLLVEEYGISPRDTDWYVASIQDQSDGKGHEIKPRDGSVIKFVQRRHKDDFESVFSALLKGEIDALGSTKPSAPLLQREKGIKRLFEDYREAEAAYFKKTRIIPIMHVVVIRTALADRHPDLPGQLFRLFSEARRLGQEWAGSAPSSVMAWKDSYLEREKELLQGDPWRYGLDSNRHVLSTFLSYCYNQGISQQQLDPRQLFAASTWELTEDHPG